MITFICFARCAHFVGFQHSFVLISTLGLYKTTVFECLFVSLSVIEYSSGQGYRPWLTATNVHFVSGNVAIILGLTSDALDATGEPKRAHYTNSLTFARGLSAT